MDKIWKEDIVVNVSCGIKLMIDYLLLFYHNSVINVYENTEI